MNKITCISGEVNVGARVKHFLMELALVSALMVNTGTHGAINVKTAAGNALTAIIGTHARKTPVLMATICIKDGAAACQEIMDQVKFAYLRKTKSTAVIVCTNTKTHVGTVPKDVLIVLIQLVSAQPVILTEYLTPVITSAIAQLIDLETVVSLNVPHKAIGGMVILV